MRLFCGISLLIVLVTLGWMVYKKKNDVFHPLCFFCIMQFLRYVPTMLKGDVDTQVTITENGVVTLFYMELLVILCVFVGYGLYQTNRRNKIYTYQFEGRYNQKGILYGSVLFIIGVATRVYFIQLNGGLTYILSNIQQKVHMVTGHGYLLAFGNFMTYGLCMILVEFVQNFTIKRKIIFVLLLACDLFFLGFMSDRTAVMRAIMIIVMVYHYKKKRLTVKSILNPKVLLAIYGIIVFIVAMPLLRNSEGFDKYGSVSALLNEATGKVWNIFYWFSYAGRDIFAYQHFNITNYWWGANILNLLCAPIPAALISWKPPVDEGYYLSNLVLGYDIAPPSLDYVYKSSFPFSNQGILFANFGIIGLIIGSICLGYVYGHMYKILVSSEHNVVAVIVSQVILYNFAFTSHDMVMVLSLIGYLIIPLILFGKLRLCRSFSKNYKVYAEER